MRDVALMDAHALEKFHFRDEKEIFEITCTAVCSMFGIQDGAVEMKFGVNNSNWGRANILTSIELAATNSHADPAWFCLTWARGADKGRVGEFASLWDFVRRNEEHSVVSNNFFSVEMIFGDAFLSAATPFVGQ